MLRRINLAHLALFLWLVAATGCANLGAVRDFAESSAKLTGYQDVTARYVGSADRQLANLPPASLFDGTRRNLEDLRASAQRDKESLLRLHSATTGYMAALAKLAGADAYAISPEIDKVSGALTESKELNINADHVKAYANVVARVADWAMAARQARDVKAMVKANGADMDKLLEAMQIATESYGFVLEQESESALAVEDYRQVQWKATLTGDANISAGRREVVSSLLSRAFATEQATRDQTLEAQQQAAAGLKEVRDAHAFMLRNIDDLSSKEAQAILKKATADLKSIRESLQKV